MRDDARVHMLLLVALTARLSQKQPLKKESSPNFSSKCIIYTMYILSMRSIRNKRQCQIEEPVVVVSNSSPGSVQGLLLV